MTEILTLVKTFWRQGKPVSVCGATLRPEQSKSVKAGAKPRKGQKQKPRRSEVWESPPVHGGEDVKYSATSSSQQSSFEGFTPQLEIFFCSTESL